MDAAEPIVDLRRRLRAWRAGLPDDELARRSAAVAATAPIDRWATPSAIAGYLAVGGELDPSTLLERWAGVAGATRYLPVLDGQLLRFGRDDAPRSENRFGIPEPAGPTVAADHLDVVVVPAVAVDLDGHRVGMGGGFYDRTFAPGAPTTGTGRRPLLIGLVHDEQVVDRVDARPWDVPLDVVLTPTRCVEITSR